MTNTNNNNKVALLNSQTHHNIKILQKKYNTEQNRINVVNVVISELKMLVHEYPIFMTKHPKTDQLQLVAILGFKLGENLYLDGDHWRATYLPLDIMRRPFQAFIPEQDSYGKGHIAIDLSAEQVSTSEGTALFDEQGNKTAYMQRIEKTFSEIMLGSQQTQRLLQQADELGLVEGITLDIELPTQGKVSLNGLFAFNKSAVDKLTGNSLQETHQSGLLQVIHLVLSSSLHLQKLINWSTQNNTAEENNDE